ncbi:hypothetical protein AAG570_009899 [Ranatra chinensis]|uniref:Integrin alpha first immunoglubulin-like domain-containing protein n=1 Tax=Ranatra chinensis TaxID=642074 RepID=A0ABD0Z7H9_9HEMI
MHRGPYEGFRTGRIGFCLADLHSCIPYALSVLGSCYKLFVMRIWLGKHVSALGRHLQRVIAVAQEKTSNYLNKKQETPEIAWWFKGWTEEDRYNAIEVSSKFGVEKFEFFVKDLSGLWGYDVGMKSVVWRRIRVQRGSRILDWKGRPRSDMATTLKSNPLASTAMPAFHVSIGTVRWLLVLIFLVGCVRADSAYGSYFDTSAPIVKRGTSGSYFGFSLAQYRTTTDGGDSKNWLLVGAPLGEGNNSVGEVWRCPVTTADDDCEQLRIGDDLASETLKAGQWLGSTVCAHRFLDDNYFAPGLCYTLKGDFQFEELWKPCKRAYYNEFEDGFCQFGTSGMIADDGTVIVGSPGSAVWKGAAFSFTTDNDLTLSDNYVYQTNNWDLQSYSYEGMAVTASSLFGNSTVYITGVPRGKGNYGMVRLYEKVRKKAPEVSSLETMMYIVGEQFGSQFGYELATADIDGNEFGISIANLGDLNGDGCEDIAVGSPYNNDAGIVYIYTGSEGGTLNLAQVISGKKYGLSYFGYSLSGGLDTDENDSGDLLVGDYESSTVLLFRSRIIYNVNAVVNKEKLSQIDPNHKNCIFGGHKSACFSVDVCFEIEDNWNPRTINLTYLIEADFKRPVKRVWFSGTEKDNLLSTIELNVKESSAEKCLCKNLLGRARAHVGGGEWRDRLVEFGFEISWHAAGGRALLCEF